jgi:hypothetical protein
MIASGVYLTLSAFTVNVELEVPALGLLAFPDIFHGRLSTSGRGLAEIFSLQDFSEKCTMPVM